MPVRFIRTHVIRYRRLVASYSPTLGGAPLNSQGGVTKVESEPRTLQERLYFVGWKVVYKESRIQKMLEKHPKRRGNNYADFGVREF